MPSSTTDTIIFDLGGVLIDWNPRYLYRKIFEEEEMEYFLTEICNPEWNEQQDAGRLWKEAIALLVAQHPKYEEAIVAYYGRWREMVGGAVEGTVDILTGLYENKNYRLYALTNWSAETWPIALELFPFLSYFEGILVSGQEMMKKPDHRIYNLMLDRFNIDPTKAVFIDDVIKNVKGAEAVGLSAIHFQSPEQLSQNLKIIGVNQI
ncbi:MAG: hydrolase [Saprospiraceae bacterium]|nr:MAG: hydrolase [Saprospiraceae bacterium]